MRGNRTQRAAALSGEGGTTMIWLICGATHTGKTVLAQRILEEKRVPYLSLDHLKMGLIRSGGTAVTPVSPLREITDAVWPVAREMARTCLENGQSLTVEGCYIPPDWEKDFSQRERRQMRCACLALSEEYIRKNWTAVRAHACDVEQRQEDDVDAAALLRENQFFRENYENVCVIRENWAAETEALLRRIL